MCLIIDRPAKTIIPLDKFKTAVMNNPDGYGLCVPDQEGVLYVQRSAEKANAEELWELLHGEFKNDKLMLHLRYTTAGKTNLRNAHPFPVLEYYTDNTDLRMAHNGTIFDYKPKGSNTDESDTRAFVRQFVRPLFKRFSKGMTTEEMLSDPFISSILSKQIPTNSVLSFMDGHGNTMQVNPTSNGAHIDEETGIWYSNKYSFNENHRSSSYTNQHYGVRGGYYQGPKGGGGNTVPFPQQTSGTTKNSSGSLGSDGKRTTGNTHALDTKTPYFTEKYEVDLEEVALMSDETISKIVEDYPEEAELLIKELLNEYMKLNKLISKNKAN